MKFWNFDVGPWIEVPWRELFPNQPEPEIDPNPGKFIVTEVDTENKTITISKVEE